MPFLRPLNQSATFGLPGFHPKTGSAIYAPGTYTLQVPLFRRMTIEVWSGGGAGGSTGSEVYRGQSGGDSIVTLPNGMILKATGGQGGQNVYSNRWHRGHYDGAGGTGGIATGGDVNTNGAAGTAGVAAHPGHGGAAGNGGAGGAGSTSGGAPGVFPGGGGGGFDYGQGWGKFSWDTGGGGGGSYCKKSIKVGQIHPHTNITITVGAGGTARNSMYPPGEGGKGGDGQVRITWS
jgi:hypothetical protein